MTEIKTQFWGDEVIWKTSHLHRIIGAWCKESWGEDWTHLPLIGQYPLADPEKRMGLLKFLNSVLNLPCEDRTPPGATSATLRIGDHVLLLMSHGPVTPPSSAFMFSDVKWDETWEKINPTCVKITRPNANRCRELDDQWMDKHYGKDRPK
jgi:hypothetical protein